MHLGPLHDRIIVQRLDGESRGRWSIVVVLQGIWWVLSQHLISVRAAPSTIRVVSGYRKASARRPVDGDHQQSISTSGRSAVPHHADAAALPPSRASDSSARRSRTPRPITTRRSYEDLVAAGLTIRQKGGAPALRPLIRRAKMFVSAVEEKPRPATSTASAFRSPNLPRFSRGRADHPQIPTLCRRLLARRCRDRRVLHPERNRQAVGAVADRQRGGRGGTR